MINLNLQVRRVTPQDHRQISSLIFHEANTHRHLDWRSALEWIGSQNFWAVDDNGLITAAFACPEDPPNVAWIRLFAHHPHLSAPEAWLALWETACAEIMASNPQAQISAIVMKQWFQSILVSAGFEPKQEIVLLKLTGETFRSFPMPPGIRLRAMQNADLPAVERVDREAFGPFWHNTRDALQRAYSQSIHAAIAEDGSGVIGYQISTGNPFGAHLARLGVKPEAQARGVGSALVSDLIRHLEIQSSRSLSVNTQADNAASLALYKKLGFARTGEYFPVFVFPQKDTA